jgi:hypothetical protein
MSKDEMTTTTTATAPRPSRRSRSLTGNLNAARHPWRTYWRRRALRREDRWVLALVAGYMDALITDKGGETEITAGEMRLAELATAARVCWLLALAHQRDLECSRFMAVERGCLRDLGTERRAKPAPRLADLLAGRAGIVG